MQNSRSRPFLSFVALATAAALFLGCPASTVVKKKTTADEDAAGKVGEDGLIDIRGVDVEEADIRGKTYSDVADLKGIFFEFDAFGLTEEARLILRNNAAYLKANPDAQVLVEGHCDERGTTEYNLALGQKRARTVREYYMRLGVDGRNIGTLSYGEERQACSEATEECWLQNRRALTKTAAPAKKKKAESSAGGKEKTDAPAAPKGRKR